MEDQPTLAEVLGGIVDADPEIVSLEATLRDTLTPTLNDLVLCEYRVAIVAVVGRTLEQWKAAQS